MKILLRIIDFVSSKQNCKIYKNSATKNTFLKKFSHSKVKVEKSSNNWPIWNVTFYNTNADCDLVHFLLLSNFEKIWQYMIFAVARIDTIVFCSIHTRNGEKKTINHIAWLFCHYPYTMIFWTGCVWPKPLGNKVNAFLIRYSKFLLR